MSASPSTLLNGFHYGVSCIKGDKGKMEDFHNAATLTIRPLPTSKQSESQSLHVPFFGVFDGHGGRKAANFAAENLGHNILDALANVDLSAKEMEDELKKKNSIEEAVRAGYLKTDEDFLTNGIDMVSGTTCVSAVIIDGNLLVVSNAGDSRAVISRRRGEAQALTCDHKAGRPDERQRIENLGGPVFPIGGVWRVRGKLAVSRAIGDANFKQWVSAEPDTTIVQITSECDFLILASDGLWDVVSDQEAVDIAKPFCLVQDDVPEVNGKLLGGPSAACQKLVDEAQARGSDDDITVMIVQLSQFSKAAENM